MNRYPCATGDPGGAPEATLFRRAQAGCRHSLNRLMAQHEGLVYAVVRRQWLGDLPFAAALQAGRIGLWRAILGYDPTRGTAFSTYAWPCIMRQVWRAVQTHQRETRETPWGIFSEPAGQPADPLQWWEEASVGEALHQMVQRLPARLRTIVVARYGLDGASPLSYRQLGARLGLSHERVRQLHAQALVWLRHPAHSQHLRQLLGRHTCADYARADALAQAWLRRRGGRHGH